MKNITEILKGLDIVIPDDKAKSFNDEFSANYKTIADYDKQKDAAKLAKESLADIEGKLKAFEGVDVDKLKGEIAKLSDDLTTAKDNHAKELAKRDRIADTDKFLSGYKFINEETRNFYSSKLESALDDDSNKGKNRKDILDSLVNGDDGKPRENIFIQDAQVPPFYAAGTGNTSMFNTNDTNGSLSLSESSKKINEHRIIK